MSNPRKLDVLAKSFINLITKCSNIELKELNMVKQSVYAKIKQEFFTLHYGHIILEDKICELALLIAYTKLVKTQFNVNHLWRNSEFVGDSFLKKILKSEAKPQQTVKSADNQHGCELGQLGGQAEPLQSSEPPGNPFGREFGQLQQLGDQVEPHQSVPNSSEPVGHQLGHEFGQL